jgi:hypothetical protein
MADIPDIVLDIEKALIDSLKLALPALKHASGRYEPDEPMLTAGQVRAECYRAYHAIETRLFGEVRGGETTK